MRINIRRGLFIFSCSMVMLVSGCTTVSADNGSTGPKIDRISAEELAHLMPLPIDRLKLDDLVRLTKEGNSADQIIAQIKATDSMYELTPSQNVELSSKGVEAKVLDYIYERRETAVRNQLADEMNRREQKKQAEVAQLKNRLWQQQRYYDPFCRGYYGLIPYGYGGYGRHYGSHFGLGIGAGLPLRCW